MCLEQGASSTAFEGVLLRDLGDCQKCIDLTEAAALRSRFLGAIYKYSYLLNHLRSRTGVEESALYPTVSRVGSVAPDAVSTKWTCNVALSTRVTHLCRRTCST